MAASILFVLPIVALAGVPAHTQSMAYDGQRQASAQEPAVAEFTAAVNRYLEIHRLLEDPLSCLTWGNDLGQTERAREAHRKAIVEARLATPRGDIFTPRVATYLRHAFFVATDHGWMAEADRTQAALARLPVLPMELEYRFINRDLVLLDTETLLVVDVLEHALPPVPTADGGQPQEEIEMCVPEALPVKGSPCDVHPELEMCWS